MNARLAGLALVVLAGCGAPLDSRFDGVWGGTTTVNVTGLAPFSYPSTLYIDVAGDAGRVENVCPSGPGALVATGSGPQMTWDGALTCQPTAYPDCNSASLNFLSGSGTLSPTGTLFAEGTAATVGCGMRRDATYTFSGSKRP